MGLFFKKADCSICGTHSSGKELKDGFLCKSCANSCVMDVESWKSVTIEQAKAAIEAATKMEQRKAVFSPDRKVGKYLYMDTVNRLWQVPSKKKAVFSYDELLRYELIENGKAIEVEHFGSLLTDFLYGGNAMEFLTKKAQAEGKNTMDEIRTLRLKLYTSNAAYPEVWIKLFRDMDGVRHNSLQTLMYFEILQKILKEIKEEILGEKAE